MSGVIFDVAGSYRATFQTGLVTTIAATGFLAAFRWTDATFAMRLRAIEASFLLTTAYGAAQEHGYDVIIGRSYSVAPSGGSAITLTGNNQKKKATMPTSKMGTALVCGAAALTAGTVTADANPIACDEIWAAAQGNALPWQRRVFDNEPIQSTPQILVANEGLIFRNLVLMGATGVGRWTFSLEWDEGIVYA